MRTTALLLIVLAACASKPRAAAAPAPQACEAEALLGTAEAVALDADAEGGLLVAGTFSGTLSTRGVSVASAGGDDVFVLRRAPAGAVKWLRRFGDAGADRVSAVRLAPDGDAIVAGQSGGRCFVARLAAADGAERWAMRLRGDGESHCRALALDAHGDVFTVASFAGRLEQGAVSKGASDILLMRLAAATGETTWSRAFGGGGNDLPRALAVDAAGRILLAGQFGGEEAPEKTTVDFGKGPARSHGDFDAFLVQLAADGSTEWVQTFGENGDDEIDALALGPAGEIYASGHLMPKGDYGGIAAHDSGNFLAFVARHARDGRREWIAELPADASTSGAVALDQAGRVWISGTFKGTLPALGLRSQGPKLDGFVAAFAPTGDVLVARSFGGAQADAARGLARIPGGIAVAAVTRGEIAPCGVPVGSEGQTTAFVWLLRDLP